MSLDHAQEYATGGAAATALKSQIHFAAKSDVANKSRRA
jgi:hypothetical protein